MIVIMIVGNKKIAATKKIAYKKKIDQSDQIQSSINVRPILRFALDNRFTDSFIQSLIGPKILQVNTY